MKVLGWALTQRTGVPGRGRDTEWALTEEGAREDTVGLPSQLCQHHRAAADLGLPAEEKMAWEKERAERESASPTAGVRQETSREKQARGNTSLSSTKNSGFPRFP